MYTEVQISFPFLIYNVFPVQGQISLSFSFPKVLTRRNQCLDLHDVYTLLTCSRRKDLQAIYKEDPVNMCKTFYTFLHGLLSITAQGHWL